ncbi:TPA: hypothetical protein DEP96_00615 [Candidatus Uhrbacteria bacterium]|nr:hypothetical protein [Candidatus Uhrbacteria bacterium]
MSLVVIIFFMALEKQTSFWPEWRSNKLFTLLLAIALVYGIVWLFVQIEKTFVEIDQVGVADQMPATITVTGEGKASQVPDEAEVDLSITSTGATSNEAQDTNSTAMNALLAKMKSLGIVAADLQTSQYNLSQTYDYDVSPAKVIGYQVTQSLTVTMRDTSLADKVLAAAGDLGVTNIGNVALTVSDTTKVVSDARQLAITKAQVQAASIASAMGQRIGSVVSYNESTGGSPYPYYSGMMADKAMGGAPSPEIAVGSNESVVNVTITYSLR